MKKINILKLIWLTCFFCNHVFSMNSESVNTEGDIGANEQINLDAKSKSNNDLSENSETNKNELGNQSDENNKDKKDQKQKKDTLNKKSSKLRKYLTYAGIGIGVPVVSCAGVIGYGLATGKIGTLLERPNPDTLDWTHLTQEQKQKIALSHNWGGTVLHSLFSDEQGVEIDKPIHPKLGIFIPIVMNGADINAVTGLAYPRSNLRGHTPLDIFFFNSRYFDSRIGSGGSMIANWGARGTVQPDAPGAALVATIMWLIGGFGIYLAKPYSSFGTPIDRSGFPETMNKNNMIYPKDQENNAQEYYDFWKKDKQGGTALHRLIRNGIITTADDYKRKLTRALTVFDEFITQKCKDLYTLNIVEQTYSSMDLVKYPKYYVTPDSVWQNFVYVPGAATKPLWLSEFADQSQIIQPKDDSRVAQLSATIQNIFLGMRDYNGQTADDLARQKGWI